MTTNKTEAVKIKNTYTDSFGRLFGYVGARRVRHTFAVDSNGSWVFEDTGDYIFNFTVIEKPVYRSPRCDFNEADCGGVFDGFCVTSDADPGL
jgi:hypothetical protein